MQFVWTRDWSFVENYVILVFPQVLKIHCI